MAEPQRTWLGRRVYFLQQVLGASHMDLSSRHAAAMVHSWLAQFAAISGNEAGGLRCVDAEFLENMAFQYLFDHAEELPGADLLELPRTVPLDRDATGLLITALSHAMQICAAHEPTDYVRELITFFGRELAATGLVIAEAGEEDADESGPVMFPPALLRRAARHVREAAHLAEEDSDPPPAGEERHEGLAASLHDVADKLIELVGSA